MELTDRLTNIVERLHQRGVTDITDRDVVNKLLSALDESFDRIVAESNKDQTMKSFTMLRS